MKWLKSNLDTIDNITKLIEFLYIDFDLLEATGKQLDVIGVIVGCSRILKFQPKNGSSCLNDDVYRVLLRARISQNMWNGTMQGVYEIWNDIFPEYILFVKDNQDMSMEINISGDTNLFDRELMSRGYITPKPQGVRLKYKFLLPLETTNKILYIMSAKTHEKTIEYINMRTLENLISKKNQKYKMYVSEIVHVYINTNNIK